MKFLFLVISVFLQQTVQVKSQGQKCSPVPPTGKTELSNN